MIRGSSHLKLDFHIISLRVDLRGHLARCPVAGVIKMAWVSQSEASAVCHTTVGKQLEQWIN